VATGLPDLRSVAVATGLPDLRSVAAATGLPDLRSVAAATDLAPPFASSHREELKIGRRGDRLQQLTCLD
jgi:hypothetical protein